MFKTLFTLSLFAATIFAQRISIRLPVQNQTVTAGDNLTVQIQLPETLSEFRPVAITLGLQSCPCFPPSTDMGEVLYTGLFQPERHETHLPPYENFTVEIPSSTTTGTASLDVAYFSLVGAGLSPTIETLNQTITIVS